MEVLIPVVGVILMGLVAYRWIFRRPPIIPEIIAVFTEDAPVESTSVWDDCFTGDLDWPWRQGKG